MKKYITRKLRKAFARKMCDDHIRFWDHLSVGDECLPYLYILFFRMYQLHLEGSHLSMQQAGSYIPRQHNESRRKYLEVAKKEGYVNFEPSLLDKRKVLLKPTEKLLKLFEAEIDREIEEVYKIFGEKIPTLSA